jgi:hypothetical protein
MKNNWIKITEGKPSNLQKIEFIVNIPCSDKKDVKDLKKGLYLESEDMFFVGFEDESDEFYFSWSIESWRPLFGGEKTAVEQFWQDVQEILPSSVDTETGIKLLRAFEQAKEIEKENIKKGWLQDRDITFGDWQQEFEQWYSQEFKQQEQ